MDPQGGMEAGEAGAPPETPRGRRPTARFMLGHPARWMALGLGSGLSPVAPGTVGTLWSWVCFLVLEPFLDDGQWLMLIALGIAVGVWACTRTARELAMADPSCIVWDEIVAFWIVLLMIQPASWGEQAVAFGLFRFFDAVKPPPVNWADQLFKPRSVASGFVKGLGARDSTEAATGAASEVPRVGWLQGWGILFDDLVAAFCVVLLWALWSF